MLQTIGQSGSNQTQRPQVNPFASALAETEKNLGPQAFSDSSNPFNDTLAQTGGADWGNPFQPDQKAQQEQLKKQQELLLQRQRLHDQINPTEVTPLFSQEQETTRRTLEQIRLELVDLVQEVKGMHGELQEPIFKEISAQVRTGKGLSAFFDHLRIIIKQTVERIRSARQLLKQSVKSSKTWAMAAGGMGSKKSKSSFVNSGETEWVQKTMHHEVSANNSGG